MREPEPRLLQRPRPGAHVEPAHRVCPARWRDEPSHSVRQSKNQGVTGSLPVCSLSTPLTFSPINPHGRLPPLPPLTPCLPDTGRQTPSRPHLPARPMTRPSTRRGTAERGGLREASAAPGRALRDPGGLSRNTAGDPIMPRQKGPERGCVCKDRGPNGPPKPCRPQRRLLRASTPQTVTREAGRRSTRRPRLQLQATVVYRSRPHQNTKPEPLSAPAAGNRGRPPPPALRKPRVQPVREASGSGSARGPSPRWLSPGQSASKLGSTLAARGQHGSVHPCHVDLVTRPSRRGDRRWPRARAVCRGSVLPGVRETIFSPTQLKGGIQSIGNQKHGLRPYKE